MSIAENKLLEARIRDLLAAADGGRLAVSRYLTSREQYEAAQLAARLGVSDRTVFFGGYPDAQRKKLFCLPEYVLDLEDKGEAALGAYFPEELSEHTVMLRITGSEYRDLKHSDYLGAILNLGCERDSIGDVCVVDDCTAWVFCEKAVSMLILDSLVKVASDGVRVRKMNSLDGFSFERKFLPIRDTVASERMDCVIAALTNLSRESAKELIDGGSVELNYREQLRPDTKICEGDVLTVRTRGKFIIRSLGERTAKGRIRLLADKYC